eukprot:TRINITY_DN29827_c0_g1_i2.p1 TRINITY_DN29827_c0_g1~~TRINITY_DN29827_c0_g1_i2.p1  ORF type:complete len:260 (+),score=38.57 TRINITY_DN29827_c0_g1_i2:102-881(+)
MSQPCFGRREARARSLLILIVVAERLASAFGAERVTPATQWFWGTPVLALSPEHAPKVIGPLAGYLQWRAAEEATAVRSNRNGAWQSQGSDFLSPEAHPEATGVRRHIRQLRKYILRAVRQYVDAQVRVRGGATPAYDVRLEASWGSLSPPCGSNAPHVHTSAAISGTFYLACGANYSVPCQINLMDPRPAAPMSHLPAEVRDNMDFGIDWTLSLFPGMLLIFPSWLNHWVAPRSGVDSSPRISISFTASVRMRKLDGA